MVRITLDRTTAGKLIPLADGAELRTPAAPSPRPWAPENWVFQWGKTESTGVSTFVPLANRFLRPERP